MTASHTVLELLQHFAGRRRRVKVERETPCAPTVSGYVLACSQEWVLLWQVHDFFPDGFTLIRVEGVDRVRFSDSERHFTRMFEAEGLVTELPEPPIALGDLASMLGQLSERNEDFIVECEDEDEDIEDFYLGRVIERKSDHCTFAHYNVIGHWDPELATIEYDEISRIQIATPYSNVFSRHVPPCPFLATDDR